MTTLANIPRHELPSASIGDSPRIVKSPRIVSSAEVSSVIEKYNWEIGPAVEHILAGLDHSEHPRSKLPHHITSPKNFINSPETALNTLELLLEWNTNIFSRNNTKQATKIALSIMFLLSEYYWNKKLYSTDISRDPYEQNELYAEQQRLTDVFHFIVWNIANNNFQVSNQLWELTFTDIIQDDSVLNKIWSSNDFPHVKEALKLFQGIDTPINKPHHSESNKKAA